MYYILIKCFNIFWIIFSCKQMKKHKIIWTPQKKEIMRAWNSMFGNGKSQIPASKRAPGIVLQKYIKQTRNYHGSGGPLTWKKQHQQVKDNMRTTNYSSEIWWTDTLPFETSPVSIYFFPIKNENYIPSQFYYSSLLMTLMRRSLVKKSVSFAIITVKFSLTLNDLIDFKWIE